MVVTSHRSIVQFVRDSTRGAYHLTIAYIVLGLLVQIMRYSYDLARLVKVGFCPFYGFSHECKLRYTEDFALYVFNTLFPHCSGYSIIKNLQIESLRASYDTHSFC
jgi:hypothetical protein